MGGAESVDRAAVAGDGEEADVFRVPLAVPVAGMVLALALMPFGPVESALTAAAVVAAGLVLLLVRRLGGGRA